MKQNHRTSATILALLLTLAALFTIVTASAEAPPSVNANKLGVALEGHDPVAFHTVAKAVKGEKSITAKHGGAVYRFASEANRAAFAKDPERYLPAYGGFCTWGISAKGERFPVEIDTWQVVGGRLFLNYNKKIQKKFNQDLVGHIAAADQKWPAVAAAAK